MIGGKLYDFNYSPVSKDVYGQHVVKPITEGVNAFLYSKLAEYLENLKKQKKEENKEENISFKSPLLGLSGLQMGDENYFNVPSVSSGLSLLSQY